MKLKYWFSGDSHFSHQNIIKYCKRPFNDITHMNETFISLWNEKVNDNDQVIFVGDFGLGDCSAILTRLNGRIVFVKGNHDHKPMSVKITNLLLHTHGKEIYVCHDPDDALDFVDINIVAHVHGRWKTKKFGKSLMINVGVDIWNYRPVSLDEIMKLYEKEQSDAK